MTRPVVRRLPIRVEAPKPWFVATDRDATFHPSWRAAYNHARHAATQEKT